MQKRRVICHCPKTRLREETQGRQSNSASSGGSRIFPGGGGANSQNCYYFSHFAENCMKMKEFGSPGGARVPGTPPWIRQWLAQF